VFRLGSFGLAFLASAAPAAAPTFNLTCAGTMTKIFWAGGGDEPYRTVFRIDLTRRLWCSDECLNTLRIASFDARRIVLQDRDKPGDFLSNVINRQTGEHHSLMSYDFHARGEPEPFTVNWEGHCEPSKFTGFPPVRQRF
jgi:hypothetical protein